MGRKFWGGLGVLASVLAGVGAAAAADLAVKAPVYKAPPPVVKDWSGFYLGVNGGYGWGNTSFNDPAIDPWFDFFDTNIGFANAKSKGGVFGGHAGYNWQYGAVVTGLEVDFDGADITGTDNIPTHVEDCTSSRCLGNIAHTMKFDELATARARLGYAVLPDLLVYGTAGAAWGHSTLTSTVSWPAAVGGGSDSLAANANNFGWAAGGGLEYHLGHGFIARGEYLHYDFAKTAYGFPVLVSPNAGTTIDVVRGGLSYKF